MSSILKALRKVEEEKRAATHAAPDLRSDQGGNVAKPKPFLALLAGAFLGVFCLGMIFFFAIERDKPVQSVAVQVAVEPVPSAPVSDSVPAPVLTPREEIIPVVRMPREPVAFTPPAPKKIKKTPRTTVVLPEKVKAPAEEGTTSREKPVKTAVQPAKPATEVRVPLPAGVVLEVTEIFYHEEAENSMAVVNDLPVMVGTPIDSAIVTAIQPEHVVFNIDDESYTVRKPR